ncbi:prepilin peptidase [bacterium]|nr:prepilin peptidase [bacterium]
MIEAFPVYPVVFIFGTVIGSFLNVVIHRIPLGESIVHPGSHCPKCNRQIKAIENIPIISYIFLRGKCVGCGSKISLQYPLVEAVMGILAVLMLHRFGISWDFLLYGSMMAVLVALSCIDIKTFRLPNGIVLIGAVIAVVLTVVITIIELTADRSGELSLSSSGWFGSLLATRFPGMILGGLTGLGLLGFMSLVGKMLFRKDTLGMGDIKLAGMMGLYLGPFRTAGMFILGAFIGALFGITMIVIGGRKWGQRIPFGPYLALGGLISLLWGELLWQWYISLAIH